MRLFKIIWPSMVCIAALVLFSVAVHNEQYWHALWMAATAVAACVLSVKGVNE